MKKVFALLALACIAVSLCCCSEGNGSETDTDDGSFSFNGKKYICTFSDEFESEKLDNHNWYYCPQQQRQDAGGWWSNECSTFENGNYVITCTTKNGIPISGGIRSRRKFEQTYGLYNNRQLNLTYRSIYLKIAVYCFLTLMPLCTTFYLHYLGSR